MEPEQAKRLLEKLEGRDVVIVGKPGAGGGMAGFNATGRLRKSTLVDGLWEVYGVGLDPTKPPQIATQRHLTTHFSECLVGGVIEMGELSGASPAAIARPAPGLFK